MNITLHQIRVFIVVAELMSVSKAAQRLHMTQPAVSNIMKQLQDHFDCQLTEIIGRKLYLTQYGEHLLKNAHKIQKLIEQTQTEIDWLKGAVSGTLRIACVSTAKYFLPKLIGKFNADHPKVRIKLTVCNRQGIITRLQENIDDFAIMSHPPKHIPVDTFKFCDDQLIVACSNQNRKHKNKSLTLSDLQDETWITREPGSGTRYAADNFFKRKAFSPNFQMEISDGEGIKQAIIANMGISVVSQQSILLEKANNLIKEINVKGFPIKHPWYFVCCHGKSLSPLAENFLEYTKKFGNLSTA